MEKNYMDFTLVYITANDKEQALEIGRTLVEEHFAACVNIVDNMTSIYRWEGKICTNREVIMIVKTTAEKFQQLCEKVKELHTYDCPCVVSLPIVDGNEQYLEWLQTTQNLKV